MADHGAATAAADTARRPSALRLVAWAVPHGSPEAHAFPERGIQLSPLCSDLRARWDVRARKVRAGDAEVPALCMSCVAVLTDAQERMGAEVLALLAARRGQLSIEENMARLAHGDR